jgi:hypothetical protein
MAVAHHRHHCTLFEAKRPGSTEYILCPRPAKPLNDDTTVWWQPDHFLFFAEVGSRRDVMGDWQ